jgi:hypothetical protein
MRFLLWKIYCQLLTVLCTIGWTRVLSPDGTAWGCKPFDKEPWLTRRVLLSMIITRKPEYTEFNCLIVSETDLSIRLGYWWGNTTVFLPDPNGQAWKDLHLMEDRFKKCPRIPRFLKHHFVERSIPEDTKVKTMAGSKVWWSQMGEDRYLFPGGIKVLSREEVYNGELWMIERPLWAEEGQCK